MYASFGVLFLLVFFRERVTVMRLRRLEFAIIALTLAFICFMGGYFTGRRGAVNIVTIEPQQSSEQQQIAGAAETPAAVIPEQPSIGSAEDSHTSAASTDSAAAPADAAEPQTPQAPQTPETAGAPRGGDGKININLASQSELTDLPGIGNVLASRIVDYRRQHGDFNRIEDLRNVSGIGDKRYEAIQDKITVG